MGNFQHSNFQASKMVPIIWNISLCSVEEWGFWRIRVLMTKQEQRLDKWQAGNSMCEVDGSLQKIDKNSDITKGWWCLRILVHSENNAAKERQSVNSNWLEGETSIPISIINVSSNKIIEVNKKEGEGLFGLFDLIWLPMVNARSVLCGRQWVKDNVRWY